MKKLLSPLVFALALILVLTQTTAAFPGMSFSGNAQVTNIRGAIGVLSLPIIGGVDANVVVGTTESHVNGTLVEMITANGESTGALVVGSVLGEAINLPIADAASRQSYQDPSASNPDTEAFALTDIDQEILTLGTINNESIAGLYDSSRSPNIVNPTSSRANNNSQTADINIGLPLLADILHVDTALATTTVETTDASAVTTQGYDAISCEATSTIAGLNVLGLISADAITTTTSATVNGQTGESAATVSILNLVVDDTVNEPIEIDLGTTPPANFNLLGGDIILSIAPVMEGSADSEHATASAVALRVEVLANVLGIAAGTVIDIGASNVDCAALRGNWNPGDDTDGDGVIDAIDLDDDNDGLPDTLEGDAALDTDGDRIPDSRDLDSDNDGANDVWEAGHPDLDLNGDGQIDGPTGENGLSDLVEEPGDSATLIYTPLDTDNDGVIDVRDLDSDNDSIADVIENGLVALDANNDAMVDGDDDDFDGIIAPADAFATYGDANEAQPADTDGDNIPNSRDLDSDNDGLLDIVENGQAALDTDDDGMINGTELEGDGILGDADTRPYEYGSGVSALDSDNDSIFNAYDLDSDNDGATDLAEGGLSDLDPTGTGHLQGVDADLDGVIDSRDTQPTLYGCGLFVVLPDADGDDVPDYIELDSDDDGTFDIDEHGTGTDADNDGMADGPDDEQDGIPESADNAPDRFGLNGIAPTAVALSGSNTQSIGNIALLLTSTLLLTLATAFVKQD